MEEPKYWAIIPAAGIGTRMLTEQPKQYLKIKHQTVLEHTLKTFLKHPKIVRVIVVLHPEDNYWPKLDIATHQKINTIIGGARRQDSVLNGLRFLKQTAKPSDWILVHDAARPCLEYSALDLFLKIFTKKDVGGLLAVPVHDTIKQADANKSVQRTIPRENLWTAQTPQMFRLGQLITAFELAQKKAITLTDEAMAIEQLGAKPRLITGSTDNIKITLKQDLFIAKALLSRSIL